MRIMENTITPTYNKNLQRNVSDLTSSSLKLSSKRQYNHISEDPVTASKASTTRGQIVRSEEHIDMARNVGGESGTADSNIITLNSILETVYEKTTKANGISNQNSMDTIAEELGDLKGEILQTVNTKYGDKFLFPGSSNGEALFAVDGDGNLLLNGKPVDAHDKNDPDMYFGENKLVHLDVRLDTYTSGTNTTKAGIKISTSDADVLGYGKNENGLSNNLYSFIGKVEEQLRDGDKEGVMDTLSQLKKKQSSISAVTSELGTREKLPDRTKDRLKAEPINLQKSQTNLEPVETETEAINNKSRETAQMTTLQLGSSIISPPISDLIK